MSTPRRKLVERASPFVLPDCALPGLRGHFSLSAYPLKDEHDAPTGAVLILLNRRPGN